MENSAFVCGTGTKIIPKLLVQRAIANDGCSARGSRCEQETAMKMTGKIGQHLALGWIIWMSPLCCRN
jgi:hypothetical protein